MLLSNQNKTIVIAGGDLRQVTVAKLFKENNRVYCVGLEQSDQLASEQCSIESLILSDVLPDYIILPLPASIDNESVNTPFSSRKLSLFDILSLADSKTVIYGGKISPCVRQLIEDRGLSCVDYLDREEMAVMNAVPTAEGAVQIVMEELPTTIYQSKCLIVGYGRISRVLAKYMKALGADVTVSARKYKDLAWIQTDGYRAIQTCDLIDHVESQQVIINTVPAVVLPQEVLERAKKDCLLIDLASKPGGIDLAAAASLGLKTIWALSLPGKVAPITAGKIIYETIKNIEDERSSSDE